MGEKCVFLDRDRTITEDPGYLTEPEAVKLLPGVDMALRSLAQAGFKLVVVTNQSGIARGMITEEGLEKVHSELRRQLSERDVHLDGIYYCPYHPEGTLEEYTRESVDRKPQPGMLLRAAKELDIDLTASWMIGDSPRDVEAGQRAGCRTIRVRSAEAEGREPAGLEPAGDEDVQADFTVRNLVDAARVVTRSDAGEEAVAAGEFDVAGAKTAGATPAGDQQRRLRLESMSDTQLLREIARHMRERERTRRETDFSVTSVVAAVFQILALLALGWALIHMPGMTVAKDFTAAYNRQVIVHVSLLSAGVLQLTALTFFTLSRRR